jgi:hypothetical protein
MYHALATSDELPDSLAGFNAAEHAPWCSAFYGLGCNCSVYWRTLPDSIPRYQGGARLGGSFQIWWGAWGDGVLELAK